jgi:hypothetical protein
VQDDQSRTGHSIYGYGFGSAKSKFGLVYELPALSSGKILMHVIAMARTVLQGAPKMTCRQKWLHLTMPDNYEPQ